MCKSNHSKKKKKEKVYFKCKKVNRESGQNLQWLILKMRWLLVYYYYYIKHIVTASCYLWSKTRKDSENQD